MCSTEFSIRVERQPVFGAFVLVLDQELGQPSAPPMNHGGTESSKQHSVCLRELPVTGICASVFLSLGQIETADVIGP